MPDCRCFEPPFDHRDFLSQPIGIDPTNGRFGEATVLTCRLCGAKWLHYHVEYEAFTASGRWFRGLITGDVLETILPQDAIPYLERLPWHFEGGSYFNSTGRRSSGRIQADG